MNFEHLGNGKIGYKSELMMGRLGINLNLNS